MSRALQDSGKYYVLSNIPEEELEHMKICAGKAGITYEIEDEAFDMFDREMPGYIAMLVPWDIKQSDKIELFFEYSLLLRKAYKERLLKRGYSEEFLDKQNIYLGCEKNWLINSLR